MVKKTGNVLLFFLIWRPNVVRARVSVEQRGGQGSALVRISAGQARPNRCWKSDLVVLRPGDHPEHGAEESRTLIFTAGWRSCSF